MSETYNCSKYSGSTVTAGPGMMADSDCLRYKIYSDLLEIRGLSQPWDHLATLQYNKAFASLEWYLANCRMDTSGTPYVVAATRGSEIICILALVLDRAAGVAMFPDYACDYNDVLVRGSDPQLVAGLLRYAISAETPCRHLKLSDLRPDSNCLAALHLLKDDRSIDCRHSDGLAYSYAELPSSFEDYLASLRGRFRRNVRRALRAATTGGLTICELYPQHLDPLELPDIYLHLFLGRHPDETIDKRIKAQSFVREALPPMFRKGKMRVFAILEKEQIKAIDLYFVTGKGLLAWNGGFLAEIERFSPGTALIAFAISRAIVTGLEELDFGNGHEAYKENWTNKCYSVGELALSAVHRLGFEVGA